MSDIHSHSTKQILKSPVELLSQAGANTSIIVSVQHLHNKYLELHSEQKKQKQLMNQLSRKIGEEKKSGNSIDALKQQVHTHSRNLKNLLQQKNLLEQQILDHFHPDESKQEQSNEQNYNWDRNYPLSNSGIFTIHELGSSTEAWDEYVNKNTSASIYHLSLWRDFIQKTFGHRSHYLYAKDNKQNIVGVLPLVRLKSRLFGDFLTSMPYFNYGGAIGDHPDIEIGLIRAASSYAEKIETQYAEFRETVKRSNMPSKTEKVSMMLKLPDSYEALWKQFSPKLRAQIRRSAKEDHEILIGKQDLLSDFYDVFAENMRDLGTPVYSIKLFSNILKCIPEHANILIVRHKGVAVSAAFLIGYKDLLEIPWASTLRKVNHLSMNMLMYSEVLKFAIEKKYSYFDFGRSSKDSGTYKFKQQWNARARPMYWNYWLPAEQALPALNPNNPKYALMISIWRKFPVFLTKVLGPNIVKNLP